MSMGSLIEAGGILYFLWWLIKWGFILFWPAFIFMGCAELFGANVDAMSDGVHEVVMIVSIIIGYSVHKYRQRMSNGGGE